MNYKDNASLSVKLKLIVKARLTAKEISSAEFGKLFMRLC